MSWLSMTLPIRRTPTFAILSLAALTWYGCTSSSDGSGSELSGSGGFPVTNTPSDSGGTSSSGGTTPASGGESSTGGGASTGATSGAGGDFGTGGTIVVEPGLGPWDVPTIKENFHIFVLMGQSNMSGFAPLEDGDSDPVEKVLSLPQDAGALDWRPATHPLHNRRVNDRFGLGLPFAKNYVEAKSHVRVGLIPLAVGGFGIDGLQKRSLVYSDFLVKLASAQEQGVIKGVLWHQGESDTVTEAPSDAYEGKLHQLIRDVRSDTGDPVLPFIVGNLAADYGTSPEHSAPDRVARINRVRSALRMVPSNFDHTGFVDCVDCTSLDNVHFDRASYIRLGELYFESLVEASR